DHEPHCSHDIPPDVGTRHDDPAGRRLPTWLRSVREREMRNEEKRKDPGISVPRSSANVRSNPAQGLMGTPPGVPGAAPPGRIGCGGAGGGAGCPCLSSNPFTWTNWNILASTPGRLVCGFLNVHCSESPLGLTMNTCAGW